MRQFNKLATSFLALSLVAGLAGCGGSSSTAASTTTNSGSAVVEAVDKINIEMTTAPVGMHPLKTNDSASTSLTGQIFETLYRRTMDGTSYTPLLAEALPEMSEDGLTATIKLRQNVTFHDGTPFTADAVAYMIDCLKDENYGSQRPSIVGSIVDYTIVDDHTIELHLEYSDGVLVAKLAHTNGAIVNPALDKSQDLLVDPTGAGTGPYKFVSATTGSNYVLEANTAYWGGEPDIKTVNYDVVADESTAVARLQTGEADFYPTVSTDAFNTVANISGYTAVSVPSSAIYYFTNRSTAETAVNPLMENFEFRKAIFEAIDVETYVDSMLDGKGTFVKSVVGPTLVGYTPEMDEAYIAYDADDAKKIIDENGWAGQTVTLLTATREWQQTAAAYIQDQLGKVGLQVNIVSEEWATFLSDAKNDKAFDLCILTWSNVTGDGQQMLEPNFSTANGVRIKYNNAEFDEAVEASAETTVLAERQAAMLKAVQLIQGDAVATPFYSSNSSFAYNSTKFANVDLDKGGLFYVGDFKVNQ